MKSAIDIMRATRMQRESSLEPHRGWLEHLVAACIEAEEPITARKIQAALLGQRGVSVSRAAVIWYLREKAPELVKELREHGLYPNGVAK